MIPHGVEVFVGLAPIDLRWGFERLAGIIRERVGREPRSGALFVFFGRRRDAMKIVFFDGTGRLRSSVMGWTFFPGRPTWRRSGASPSLGDTVLVPLLVDVRVLGDRDLGATSLTVSNTRGNIR